MIEKPKNTLVELLEKFPDKPWNWEGLSCNEILTFDTVLKYSDKPWDWSGLSENRYNLKVFLFVCLLLGIPSVNSFILGFRT